MSCWRPAHRQKLYHSNGFVWWQRAELADSINKKFPIKSIKSHGEKNLSSFTASSDYISMTTESQVFKQLSHCRVLLGEKGLGVFTCIWVCPGLAGADRRTREALPRSPMDAMAEDGQPEAKG